MRPLRDLKDIITFLWAWYAFPVLEALGLWSRRESRHGDEATVPGEPGPESPLGVKTPAPAQDSDPPVHG